MNIYEPVRLGAVKIVSIARFKHRRLFTHGKLDRP